MAKMYYNAEETRDKLGCDEDQLKQWVQQGKLREFRDAGKLSYRVDEVDKLASELGGGSSDEGDQSEDTGEIPLASSDDESQGGGADESGGSDTGVLSLADDSGELKLEDSGSSSGSGGEISLEDKGSDSGEMGLSDSGGGTAPISLEDSGSEPNEDFSLGGSGTAAAEVSLEDSGSEGISLEDSGGEGISLEDTGETGQKPEGDSKGEDEGGDDVVSLDQVDKDAVEGMKKDDTVITNIGISVFDDDDLEITADPMAKTLMTGGDEHLGLDGSGGGSGLMDLTRESDDTSLGAELLEGIDMGDTAETETVEPDIGGPGDSGEEGPPEEEEMEPLPPPTPGGQVAAAPVGGFVEAASPAFTGLLIAASIALLIAAAANIALVAETRVSYVNFLGSKFLILIGGCLALGGVFALVGWMVGRQAGMPAKPKAAKKEKKKKEKKPKKPKKTKAKKGKKGK